MKSLQEHLNDQLTESIGLIKYDEKKHITGVDFSELTNVGNSNIIKRIEDAQLAALISPEEEEFDYQWMNIYWDQNMIEFYMPNNFTNGAPMGFKFKIKINPSAMKRWLNGDEWKPGDFSLYQIPGSFAKMAQKFNTTILKNQLCELMAIVMNSQPEPLW